MTISRCVTIANVGVPKMILDVISKLDIAGRLHYSIA